MSEQISGIVFTINPGNVPATVSLSLENLEDSEPVNEMETVLDAALIIRRQLLNFRQEHKVESFEGSLVPNVADVDPLSYMFFKTVLAGKMSDKKLVTKHRQDSINAAAINLTMNTMFGVKTDRQAYHTPK